MKDDFRLKIVFLDTLIVPFKPFFDFSVTSAILKLVVALKHQSNYGISTLYKICSGCTCRCSNGGTNTILLAHHPLQVTKILHLVSPIKS